MVHIDDRVFEFWQEPWKDALVVKLLGKSLGFHTLRYILQHLWKFKGGFEIIYIGNIFFMVKLDLEGDQSTVMKDDPWVIFNHYLTVKFGL